ncbi:DUF2267 domain-containing protein [Dactylosporangium sp. CA-139114]|uniref:DUF2267 domain-containing protein n=1 Tax=Dactylosporangium sp. CA-139114 TaxID=3239931 RepID=UPI003D95C31D
MDADRFLAIVRREAELPDSAAARDAVRAVFVTLSERLMAGVIQRLRAHLPDELAQDLRPQPHQPFDADEFLRRVAERAGSDVATAERYAKAVFLALSRALEPEDLKAVLSELSKDFRPLTEKARRPANQLREFVGRVADRTGLDEQRALSISEAVLETLAERIAGGEVDDLIKELPHDLRPALERGKERSAGRARKMELDEFLTLVADRAGVSVEEARDYAGAVLATIHDAVTEKEFRDLVSELPRSYVELAHA